MSRLSPAQQEQWNDAHDGAPTIVVLWDKTSRAARPHQCSRCGDEIAVGEVYETRGYIIDGEREFEKTHRWANQYPSGCPKFKARDVAEINAADAAEAR